MKQRFRKGIALLLTGILLALSAGALGDTSGSISGTTAAASSFTVNVTGNGGGYIRITGAAGAAYVADYDYYGNLNGYKTESAFGFFRVDVTGTGYSKSYTWAPSATAGSAETSKSMVIAFPMRGVYQVSVTPLSKDEINGTYWAQNRFQSWTGQAAWVIDRNINCTLSGGSSGGGVQPQPQPQPGGAAVTVYCRDSAGNTLSFYTEQITYSRTIYPKAISGYTATTSGQYVNYYSNGTCSPGTVIFYYQRASQASGAVTVECRDIAGNTLSTYTEQVTYSRTIYPKPISGYTAQSASRYITCSGGTCTPSTVIFYYQRAVVPATVSITCVDTSGATLRFYTQSVTNSTTIYPQNINGYKTLSGGQQVTYSNGTCNPSTITFQYEKYAVSADVTVDCYDLAGTFLESYTETVSFSRAVTPRQIDGYSIASGPQYVTFANGACTPSRITFKYQKVANPATLTVDCYDIAGNYIRSYTETITASRTVNPRAISGYNIVSGGQAVTYSDGTCSPSQVSFTYQKIPTPAAVTIRCIDNNGATIRSYTETVTANKTVSPPFISGYTALSSPQQVTYSDGTCSPGQIDFQYQVGSPVTPGGNPEVMYPSSWDTQFKPGTAREGNGNEHQVDMLPNIHDDNPTSVFGWIWWSSESDLTKDTQYPELTAYFDGGTVSSVGIRNGNQAQGASTYRKYARATRFFLKIYDTAGNMSEFTMDIPDQYTGDYRVSPLGRTYTNVSRIEFWIAGYANGDSSKHVIYISDIIFYK